MKTVYVEFVAGDILRGPRGGEVEVARVYEGRVFVHKRHGWNTMTHELKHPDKYVKIDHRVDKAAAIREAMGRP